ncbi:hypothetical protein COHA_009098 [Chlorella ohadii]|uniref:Uncharacterized protein n=1 Tax=Chlorella ohadii TaxID=2649997 RepID=A0AAD5GY54_9CHLO|nr:hypothetical protein COHA_009098 [Chlorella ohadii]
MPVAYAITYNAMPCHCSVPVLLHQGVLYRGMELVCDPQLRWPQSFQAVLIYAPAAADLLDPASWHASAPAGFDSAAMLPSWMPGPVNSGGFLEGNAVALPSGRVGLLLRCRVYDAQGRTYTLQHACLFHLEPPPAGGRQYADPALLSGEAVGGAAGPTAGQLPGGRAAHASASSQPGAMEAQQAQQAQHRHLAAAKPSDEAQLSQPQPQPPLLDSAADVTMKTAGASAGPLRLNWQGFVEMPGGGNKFTARFDPSTRLYLALTNPSIDRYGANSDARNILALVYSKDLLSWRVAATLLVPNDGLPWDDSLWRTAYQYPDWIVDGPDLLVAIRTAWGGAASFHDNNWLTFKRVADYRSLLPAATAVAAAAA